MLPKPSYIFSELEIKMQSLELVICMVLVAVCVRNCDCDMDSFFKIEFEGKAVDGKLNSTYNETTDSELQCYMSCLNHQKECCLLDIKLKGDDYHCIMYNQSANEVSAHSESGSKIVSKIECPYDAKDCKMLKAKGKTTSGVYNVKINGNNSKIYCDMVTNEGGWTVFQRRFDGKLAFNKTWEEYKHGFGDVNGEHWLGNEIIHQLTKGKTDVLLRIEGTDFNGVTKHITMRGFRIEDETSKFKLHAGVKVDGEIGLVDNWLFSDKMLFSTIDEDHDKYQKGSCSHELGKGGWWFAECLQINPNGEYSSTGNVTTHGSGIVWRDFIGFMQSLKSIKMQLK